MVTASTEEEAEIVRKALSEYATHLYERAACAPSAVGDYCRGLRDRAQLADTLRSQVAVVQR